MKVEYHIRGLRAGDQVRQQLVSGLQDLNALIPIAYADILLEKQRDSTPPYQALVLLGVPGPDIHAAARDHTWAAAWLKVTVRLRQQIEARQNRQETRRRGPRHLHTAPWRPNGVARADRG